MSPSLFAIPGAILVTVLLLSACGASPPAGPHQTWSMPVEVQPIVERAVGQEVRAGGTLEPAEIVLVTTRVQGGAERVLFQAGDTVQAGQVLVEIEPERYRIAVDRARALQAKAEAQLAEMQASLDRREHLDAQSQGTITTEELVTWRSRLAQAQADVALAQAGLAQAQLDARDAGVRAPLTGVIESRSIKAGQYLPVGTVVATQVQRLPLRLSARVDTAEASLLVVGQAAQAWITTGQRLDGRIVLIGSAADAGSRTVEVIAEVATAPPTVVAGCFAELVALGSDAAPRPVVPQAALRATERGYQGFVAVEEGGRTIARARIIEAGRRTADGWVEVRSGVAAGELLVVNGADSLRDGQAIAARAVGAPGP
jgi:membrane fusion protein (multidrug efflux system)/multidrug efflux system membrane fusion protein